ncbi:accessory factor UbiK family protein [Marinobacterium weihaiense]|uniref:Ubiquinone biosynthesis accessory factor UbiK n=1 Tax=Marinobacterium weihaiense TaxID=2851016 RepID=A0ABS6MA93_9GAMM|nr:accessory factor UbiK family protein [Marinobacterium weihaiense]MBV0933219.1 accessory factor UbiK family protein [Marinobacterium weihaiense]
MIHQKLIDNLSSQFSQLLGSRPDMPGQQELQQQVKTLLQGSFAKLDLVTRDEFDAQQAVLLRTRERLEQLEARLAALESDGMAAAETAAPEQQDDTPR